MSEETVHLRPMREADLPDYVRWLNDPEITGNMIRSFPGVTVETARPWYQDPARETWAIEVAGRHVGACSLHLLGEGVAMVQRVIIGDKASWGKGYGKAAMRRLLERGFAELGLQELQIRVNAANARALALYRSCGFRQRSITRDVPREDGVRVDVVEMAITRAEWQAGGEERRP